MRYAVIDTSVLSAFARSGELELLCGLIQLQGLSAVSTREVIDEIRRGRQKVPELDGVLQLEWLGQVSLGGLEDFGVFAEYSRLLGSGTDGDIGEATVLAWAERRGGIALLDERAGTQAGKNRGVEVHGSLWLVAEGIRRELLGIERAIQVVDGLRSCGARLPCDGATFVSWAREHGLLDVQRG